MPNITFSPPPGINPDDTVFSAEGMWATCSNVRFVGGKPQVIGGWTASGATPAPSGTPSKMFEWTNLAGSDLLAIGTSTGLYVQSGATNYDVTPTGLGTVTRWSLSDYGQTLLANPTGGKLYQWSNNTGAIAAEITQSPDVITRMLVTDERQVLAFGCNEEVSGTFNGLCIRGSDTEDPTDWTSLTTNNAFEHILDGPGKIVTALHLGDNIAILTTTGLWLGQFIGDPSQTYRFDRVGSGCGCLGMDTAIAVDGVLYWITPDYQFYVWTPGSVPLPMKCPLQQTFRTDQNTAKASVIARTFAVYNGAFNEVWFFYLTGSSGSAQPTKYVAVSLVDGKWFAGQFARTAMHQGINYLWGITSAGVLYKHESGSMGASTSALSWTITSGFVYVKGAERDVMLKEVWGDFEPRANNQQAGSVSVSVATSRYPLAAGTGNVTGSQVVVFTTSTVKKSLRLSGRLVQVTLSGDDTSGTTDTFMRLGKLVFDAEPTGRR